MAGAVGFVGRENEVSVLEESLALARAGHPQVVYIEADPGAGKSTLLSEFLTSVTEAVVLEVRADEEETLLPYGMLNQLSPGPPTDPGEDPMVAGARLVDLLDLLQTDGKTIVVVIDDLQWVDRPSSRALLFALRRLRNDTVLTVVATRPEGLGDSGWARFVAGNSRVTRIRLGGLTSDDLVNMVSALGLGELTRAGAIRLAAHTGGNPLYCRALIDEIGIAVLDSPSDHGLPAPRDLSAVILTRVAALSSETQSFLAAASILGQHAPVQTALAVAGLTEAEGGADGAVIAGLLVEGASSELSFAHPFYRAAIYGDLSPSNRRRLHGRAADISAGRVRLVHRVAAVLGADDALADDLEAAASRSSADGDTGATAWALEQAAAVSSLGAERERRLLDAAVAHLGVADSDAAARVLSGCQAGSARREALIGLLGVYRGSPDAEDHLLAAWTTHDPESEPTIGARAATSLANWMVILGRPEEGTVWAERAVEATQPGTVLRAMALTAQAYSLGTSGQVSEGLAVLSFLAASGNDVPRSDVDALIMRGILKLYGDDPSAAIADLGVAAARMRTGVAATYPVPCLVHLSEAHFRRGDWDSAVTYAQLAISLAQDGDRPLDLIRAHTRSAQVLSCRGQWSAAEDHVRAALFAASRFPAALAVASCAVAAVALASAKQDHIGVLAATEQARATNRLDFCGRPGIFNWRAGEIDALIGLGRFADAETALGEFAEALPDQQTPTLVLTFARCEGTWAMATGDRDRAAAALARGLAVADEVSNPLERALLRFEDGRRLRAIGQHEAAVAQLEAAHRVLSDLGADPYLSRCAGELELLEVSAEAKSPAALLGLSRAELAVARLVATGLTNREVASQLFVSVKTVEYHLRNTFMKLDITSRRGLADLLR